MAGVVVDANVLIGLFDSRDAHHDWVRSTLATHSSEPFATTALTLAEVLVGPAQTGTIDDAQRACTALGLESFPIQASDAAEIAKLRAITRLRMPDVVVLHLATTLNFALATCDKALVVAAKRAGVPVLSPYDESELVLFKSE